MLKNSITLISRFTHLPRSRRSWVIWLTILVGSAVVLPQLWAMYSYSTAFRYLADYRPLEARAYLGNCLMVWPSRPDVHLIASRAARQAGDLESAEVELRNAQRLAGANKEDIAFEWALLQASYGNIREVEEYLNARVLSDPRQGPLVWEALIEGYLRVYRTLDAMTTADHWLNRDPENVRALELRGITFITGKGIQRGSEDLRKVVETHPERDASRVRLVRALLDLGAYEEALAHIEIGAKKKPLEAEMLTQKARCELMLGKREEARTSLKEALAIDPENGLALRTSGQLSIFDDKPAEAEEWLRRAAEAWPADYQTHHLLFLALQQQPGKLEEAKKELKLEEEVKDRSERLGELRSRRLAERPLDPALHTEMGALLIRSGQPAQGEKWLLSALSLDPEYATAHAFLYEYYLRNGDTARAALHKRQRSPQK